MIPKVDVARSDDETATSGDASPNKSRLRPHEAYSGALSRMMPIYTKKFAIFDGEF